MEDPTSPAAPNASEVVWPTPAVPGQGIPWRNGDRTESRSPASTGVPVGDRNSASVEHAQVSALGTGPIEPEAGDRTESSGPPVPEPGPRIPGEHGAPRADGEGHGPRASAGTVAPDGGSGTGDRAGTSGETAEEGAALLDDLRAAIGRYVVLPSEEALTAVTLWVAASHIQPALQHAPRLAVVGPTKGCGKSRVLDVLHETVSRPMMTVNTSLAVVFRIIGEDPPTLLVDAALAAFGDALHNIASATTSPHRADLRSAAMAFNRARRSAIRADHQAATTLRKAAKELAYASSEPGGLAIALLFATVHLARAAAKWHEQRGHEQQGAAAEEALRHLHAGYQQAAAPVLANLAHRAPRAATARRFEQDVRAALPDHADRILADTAWAALTTTLAQAETAGHSPRRLLAEVGTQRELDSAEHPTEVLNWRISAQPNKRAQAARRRNTVSGPSSMSTTPHLPATPVAMRPEERSRHR
ncbi:hypothetical protein [Streptomyces sp. NPDC006639]|uniref:hypothetical protein n=1 Tax=Streptomyces sp. NPDC006639 TaxID=3364753 RepID=UPI00369DE163